MSICDLCTIQSLFINPLHWFIQGRRSSWPGPPVEREFKTRVSNYSQQRIGGYQIDPAQNHKKLLCWWTHTSASLTELAVNCVVLYIGWHHACDLLSVAPTQCLKGIVTPYWVGLVILISMRAWRASCHHINYSKYSWWCASIRVMFNLAIKLHVLFLYRWV